MINDKNIKPDTLTEGSPSSVSAPDLAQLQAQIRDMQMEIDILKETINVLKKDPGIDQAALKNREKAVMIAYGSIYGNTENAAQILACRLADLGVKNIRMYDVSVTHPSVIISEAFRCSHLVLAASSYNGGVFTPMENLLCDLKAHNFQNRTVAVLENGTWAPQAGSILVKDLEAMGMEILGEKTTMMSSLNADTAEVVEKLADEIAASMR